jgi:acetoin utilization deacetylase AcuC-like enzyme
VTAIHDRLLSSRLLDHLELIDPPLATDEQILRAHSVRHLREIEAAAPGSGHARLDADTSMNPHSLQAARRAAGAVICATEAVLSGHVQRAFCNIRPPGHHATREAAMGFCLFNNAVIGLRHALAVGGIGRVALIDFDVHHGNGSEDILAGDEHVLMVSTFQRQLYPFSGDVPLDHRFCNVGLQAYSDGASLRRAVEEEWEPALRRFGPQMLFISAGFDAHRADDLAQLAWTEDDYHWVTERLAAIADDCCDGRIVSVLEGGYNLPALARSVEQHMRALMGL